MSDRNDAVNGTDSDDQRKRTFGRRRMLQLAGVSAVGTAVASTTASAATADYPNRIVFDGTNVTSKATYQFGVSEGVEPANDVGPIESDDSIDGTSVTGSVVGDKDAYDFAGSLTSLQVDGNVQVTVDYGGKFASTSEDRLEIVTPADGSVEYEFTTTDEVTKVLDNGKNSAESGNDTVTSNDDGTYTVAGLTGNGYGDTFDLSGDVSSFTGNGEFTLLLNGTQVTVDELTVGQDQNDSVASTGTHMLEIVTPADGSVEYSFTASGQISKVLDNGDNSAEPNNDTVTENDDGTWTVTGMTGNGYGDTVEFEGEPIEFGKLDGQYTLYLDGDEISLADLTGQEAPSNKLEIVTPGDGEVRYEFTASGEISKDLSNGKNSAESGNDEITQNDDGTWTAAGWTGNGYGDTYEFQGEPQAFSPKEGSFSLHLNGQQVTAYELLGEEPPADGSTSDSSTDGSTNDSTGGSTNGGSTSDNTSSASADNGPIGGGAGYGRTVTRSDANIVVHNASELADALSAASSGEVVFVPGDVQIDLGSRSLQVPSGVTLASNRGVDDAPGGMLYTNQEVNDSIELQGGARFTGLRMRGPHPGDDRSSGGSNAGGVHAHGDDEIDNNQVWGFSHCGVGVQNGSRAHVHHNVIKENNRNGLGYGVWVDAGDPIIEYNYFNYNRHSVAESSDPGSYTVRYNHFGPKEVLHNIDMHAPCGDNYDVHNNVVETVNRVLDGNVNHIVSVRDVPRNQAVIQDNWFFNPNAPDPNGPTDTNGQVIIQPKSSSWQNVSFSGNTYGTDGSTTYSDVIPGYDGWRT